MIRATVSFIKGQAEPNYINVSAQDFRVRARSFDNPFFVEVLTLGEVVGIAYAKPETDNFAVADVNIFEIKKPVPDNISFGDSVLVEGAYLRSITSALTLNDVINSINTGESETSITNLNELIGLDYTTTEISSLTYNDLLSHLLSKIELDSVTFSSTAVLQPRKIELENLTIGDSDILEFGKNQPDELIFSDNQSFQHAKTFGSGFTLTSVINVGNEFLEDDTDIFSFSDTIAISRVHGRALGNMVLGSTQLN
tara:strand:- start:922 stop:1683 length:762 start_codon:yes stop_codon:yes gene_type:complete